MEAWTKQKTIERICRMEQYFDCVQAAVKSGNAGALKDPAIREMLDELIRYYENGQWLADYRLDEEGGLPPELKRGVLSEDGVYNLLSELPEQKEPLSAP